MEQDVHINYNIGISSFPQDGESIDTLLQHAEIARAHAKLTEKNGFCYYSRELWEHVQDRIALESGLRKGLERNEFRIHYQPKVDAATQRMVGMEALLRWQPTGSNKLVPPVIFIPILEESGLIVDVGEWILETACQQYMEWRKQGMGAVRLSVNISAIQFHSGKLPELVAKVLQDTGMPADMLCLELTESIVVKDIKKIIEMLTELSDLGVKLSIDDFGTGYSSLSYLKDMPINELKIDRSFVMNLPSNGASVAIVESVLAMSKGMRMTVVAEGVETQEQASFLASRGCHELQGYLFSKPLPVEELFGWCRGNEYCEEHKEQGFECNWDVRPSENIEQIAGSIAHDFKNILTGIVGNLSLAQIHLDESHKSAVAIKRAEKASERATDLAQTLMNLAKPASTTRNSQIMKDTAVKCVVEECLALSLADKKILQHFEVADDSLKVAIEENELCQVLNNLFLNAAQAMQECGEIYVYVDMVQLNSNNVLSLQGGSYVRILIRDTGCGIPAEIQEKLFDYNFTTKQSGNGLGLASVKRILDKNKGYITIESELGLGATVLVIIPAAT